MNNLTALEIQQAFDWNVQVYSRSNGYELDVSKNFTEKEVTDIMKGMGCVPYAYIPGAWIRGETVAIPFYGSLSGFKKKGGAL